MLQFLALYDGQYQQNRLACLKSALTQTCADMNARGEGFEMADEEENVSPEP